MTNMVDAIVAIYRERKKLALTLKVGGSGVGRMVSSVRRGSWQ